MARTKQRTPALREHVRDVAVAMLAEDGVAGFTTRKVAQTAGTSVPAVYELFGDKAGLVREVLFEGFRQLARRFDALSETDDPRADLIDAIDVVRRFAAEQRELADVMYSRPFADFDPGAADLAAGAATRTFVVGRVQRCVDAGLIRGNATDVAHALLALAHGLAAQESAGWLGTSRASMNRRWALALDAMLDGLR